MARVSITSVDITITWHSKILLATTAVACALLNNHYRSVLYLLLTTSQTHLNSIINFLNPQPSYSGAVQKFCFWTRLQVAAPAMDEAFWASVVKKWSDASQHALTLQRDLQDVQAEVSADGYQSSSWRIDIIAPCTSPVDIQNKYAHSRSKNKTC